MKRLAAIAVCWIFSGCASTTFYENGQKIMTTQADMTNVNYSSGKTRFHADTMVHSIPTLAGGAAVQGDINAVASAAAVIGSAYVAHAAVPMAPTAAIVTPAVSAAAATAANAVSNPPSKTAAIANAAVRPATAYHRGGATVEVNGVEVEPTPIPSQHPRKRHHHKHPPESEPKDVETGP